MKCALSVFVVVGSFFKLALGQDSLSYKEPDFVGTVVLVGSKDYKVLEQETSSLRTKGGFYSKIKSKSIISGLTSKVRIHPVEQATFLIRVPDNHVNPKSIINVFKLEVDQKSNERFITVLTSGTFSGINTDIKFEKFEYERYGKHCILVKFPRSSLAAGEYAITLEGSRQIFNTFTITTEL